MRALVVGGTGPSGYYIVEELLSHGHEVVVLHSGAHEREFSRPVSHIHADVRSAESILTGLGQRCFDVAVNTGGRLKPLIETLPARVERLITISGVGVYQGAAEAGFDQFGAVAPIAEDAPRHSLTGEASFYTAVVQGENAIMEAHRQGRLAVTILRYPWLYGPHAYWRHEWYLVKRILDGRRQIALPAYGLTLLHRGHGSNLAHAAVLAAESAKAVGQIYNAGDEQVLSTRQVVDLAAEALNHSWDIVPVSFDPIGSWSGLFSKRHLILDLNKIRTELGYRDVVDVQEGMAEYVRWLAANPALPGSSEAAFLGNVFDYAQEDAVIERTTGVAEA